MGATLEIEGLHHPYIFTLKAQVFFTSFFLKKLHNLTAKKLHDRTAKRIT